MALNQRTQNALNSLRQKLVKKETREKFRPGTPEFSKAMRMARMIIGVKFEDAGRLAEHLSSASRVDCQFLVCIKCGGAGWKEDARMNRSPFEMVWGEELRKPQLAGFSYAIQFMELHAKPNARIVIRNGFCQNCAKKMKRRFPPKLRDRREGRRLSQPVQVKTAEEAITVLQEHNIIFNEKRFKDAFEKSKKIF